MTTYTLYSNGILEQDGFYLPANEFNPDYLAYLAWVALGNNPVQVDASVYLAKQEADRLVLVNARAESLNMIARLDQIANAANPPFTAAGFNLMAQAVRDEALYEKRILQFLRRLLA